MRQPLPPAACCSAGPLSSCLRSDTCLFDYPVNPQTGSRIGCASAAAGRARTVSASDGASGVQGGRHAAVLPQRRQRGLGRAQLGPAQQVPLLCCGRAVESVSVCLTRRPLQAVVHPCRARVAARARRCARWLQWEAGSSVFVHIRSQNRPATSPDGRRCSTARVSPTPTPSATQNKVRTARGGLQG